MGSLDLKKLLELQKFVGDIFSVCDIGATQLYCQNDTATLREFVDAYFKKGAKSKISAEFLHKISNLGYAKDLWQNLNYSYMAVDTSSEANSIYLDLNFDNIPKKYKGKFQLVLNLGTTEHVANQIQAFKIIHDLCSPEGVMYHHVPFQGYQTHGLVNYTAKFFWMLCRSNNYELLDMDISSAEQHEGLHEDIMETLKKFKKNSKKNIIQTTQSGLMVALKMRKKKQWFVPPFDGHVQGTLNGIPGSYYKKYKSLFKIFD